RHLYMQASEETRSVRKLINLLLAVIVILAITDKLIGLLLSHITDEPPLILRVENVRGLEALWSFSEAGVKPIVFTGSSQTYTGISPHLFDQHLQAVSGQEIKSTNVSIVGAVAVIQRDLIRNLIIPNHPQTIIYGIEMRALVPDSQDENAIWSKDFRNKPLGYAVTQPSAFERNLSIWLLEHSSLVSYRDNIQQWLSGTRLINQVTYATSAPDDLGYAPFPNKFSQDGTFIKTQFIPFTVTDTTRQILMGIGETCKQNGTQCILLNMPLHELAYQYISPAEELLYRNLLKEANLPIWDFDTQACHAILGDKDFYNLNHLNSRGAELFSQMVADAYANVYFNVPISGNATCMTMTN
ncbi:MAG: hypothetical protein ABI970_17310, partial [Chloroflexota bacterium]